MTQSQALSILKTGASVFLTGDTLSMIDTVCREIKQSSKPFGGIQVIFAGDFFNSHRSLTPPLFLLLILLHGKN